MAMAYRSSTARRARISMLDPGQDPTATFLGLYDEELERGILSSLIICPELYDDVAEIIQPGDFFILRHAYMFHAIGQALEQTSALDVLTLMNAVEKSDGFKHLDKSEFRLFLDSVFTADAAPSNVILHAKELAANAARLRLVKAIDELRQEALAREPVQSLVAKAEQRIFDALAHIPARPTDMPRLVNALRAGLEHRVAAQTTGMVAVDDALGGGFYPGELALLVGMAGHGKTSLALSWLYHRARMLNKRDVLFSLEMRHDAITRVLLSAATGIRRDELQRGAYKAEEVQAALEILSDMRLHIVDEYPDLTPGQLRHRLRRLLALGPVDLVVVDGLWLMRTDARPDGKRSASTDEQVWAQMHEITMRLSDIAKSLNVPILLLHQFAKSAWGASEPDLSALGGGLSAARNADIVLALWKQRGAAASERQVHVLKNRHRNAGGPVDVFYNPDTSTYSQRRHDDGIEF